MEPVRRKAICTAATMNVTLSEPASEVVHPECMAEAQLDNARDTLHESSRRVHLRSRVTCAIHPDPQRTLGHSIRAEDP